MSSALLCNMIFSGCNLFSSCSCFVFFCVMVFLIGSKSDCLIFDSVISGYGGYCSMGNTNAFTRCNFIFWGRQWNLFKAISACFAFLFIVSAWFVIPLLCSCLCCYVCSSVSVWATFADRELEWSLLVLDLCRGPPGASVGGGQFPSQVFLLSLLLCISRPV